jgi:single-stranded DNA-binding protein
MTNRITLQGKLLDVAKVRTFEARGETFEVVQLWIEVTDGQRRDRFNVDVHDGKAATAAKALPKDALVEITGKLRHDRWQDQAAKAWRGKIYIAVEPGEGTVRSKGLATAEAA